MLKTLLTFLLILFTSCQPVRYNIRVDSEFIPFVQRFEARCGIQVKVSIIKVDFVSNVGGEWYAGCRNFGPHDPRNIIYVQGAYWDAAGDSGKEELLSHELGHCVLNRRHLPGLTILNGRPGSPISIMNPEPFGDIDNIFDNNKEYYYNELCRGYVQPFPA